MSKILVILSLTCMLASGALLGANSGAWKQLAVDGPSSYYIDEHSITLVGGQVEALELADYPDDGSNWRSIKSRVRYNCSTGAAGVISSEFFSGSMATGYVTRSRVENAPYKISEPGTPAFWLTAFVCAKHQSMGPNNSFKPKPLRGSA